VSAVTVESDNYALFLGLSAESLVTDCKKESFIAIYGKMRTGDGLFIFYILSDSGIISASMLKFSYLQPQLLYVRNLIVSLARRSSC
jgi:hypothetical protein